MSTLVTSRAALAAVTARARQAGVAAIDTEFVWTRTYYPILGLIQIALAENEVYLLDAPAVEDPGPVAELLAAPEVVKVLHDAGSDLTILHRFCGALPRNVFDVRLAAGFCGLTATLSLGRLLRELLGIELPKTEARSDWLARPLTAAQVAYAMDDVRYMPQMYGLLLGRLGEYGNRDWALEEMRSYEAPEAYEEAAPEEAYRSVKGAGRLTPAQAAILRELAAWRLRKARETDRPLGRILRDEHLLDLALRPPASEEDLRQGWRGRVREFRRHREAILACVARARSLPPDQWVRMPRCPLSAALLKERSDALLALAREAASARGIDPTLAAPRRLVSTLVISAARGVVDGHPLLKGWRGELLGTRLTPLLESWRNGNPAPPASEGAAGPAAYDS